MAHYRVTLYIRVRTYYIEVRKSLCQTISVKNVSQMFPFKNKCTTPISAPYGLGELFFRREIKVMANCVNKAGMIGRSVIENLLFRRFQDLLVSWFHSLLFNIHSLS